ncbi:MAG TPA: NAD-dependent succinate-semialdehyde dehydrogenase [Azospirillaceae bacterium]|nr:NAD-dependent succinate-semialdehyde dehydrogenase [Azospirillaceae bacterium]
MPAAADPPAPPRLADGTLLRAEAFIDGLWQPAASGRRFAVHDPANGGWITDVADLDAQDAAHAIAAAPSAGAPWRRLTARERGGFLRRWAAQLLTNAEDLAQLICAEVGKPLREARAEVASAAAYLDWFAEEGRRAYGEIVPSHRPDARVLVLREPVGIVAAITPWNFPLGLVARKCAPALAAGCPVIVKPSELSPLSALALAVLAERAGLPPGLLAVLPASRENTPAVGSVLTGSPQVRLLSFTGSTATGRALMAACAGTVKRLSLELGGNAAFIVFEDADLDLAVAGAVAAKFRNAGQTCICPNRLLVAEGIYDSFAERLAEATAGLVVGDGRQDGTDIGPLINQAAVARLERQVSDALEKGARLVLGGGRHARGGTFFEPTLLTEVTPDMAVAREEIFGPVAPLMRFSGEAAAVRLANGTEHGLAAYIYTRDLGRALRVSEALEAGVVGLNESLVSTEVAPFGGVKQSGLGREGGRQGLEDYLETKYVLVGDQTPPGDVRP